MNDELRERLEEMLAVFEASVILNCDYSRQYKLTDSTITKDELRKTEQDADRAYTHILEFFDELTEEEDES